MTSELPSGTVTFLFTDIEGSTKLWEEAPDAMMRGIETHDSIIDKILERRNGISVKPRGEGDSRFIVFPSAADAITAVVEIQRQLAEFAWDLPNPIRVRASLHTGQADLQLGDYYGPAVNRAARIRGVAHGGQTVISSSTRELVVDRLPDGVTLRDMGEHSLKDLARPEHIYQLDIEGMNNEFPALMSLDNEVNNLPVQLNDLVGREEELEQAKKLLSETRLLTILAPGGTGKTRLSLQVGADLAASYPDGVYFVDLAPIADSDEIIQTIAESIGLAFSTNDDQETELHRYLANKTQLLIIDNFEHVVDGAGVVTGILGAAPGVSVLATSRSKLRLSGETVLTLGGLKTEWRSPDDVLTTSGVRLFIDASKRANAAFALDPNDLDPLTRVLRATGGMPLAILLAAAWTDMLPIADIAREIEESLDFLEAEMGDVPDRHRSIRAVFEYSWKLLDEDEKKGFAGLSVFRGGFTRDAAREVTGVSIRQLATLASKSLLVVDPDSGRYSVHELLRQFAATELESDRERSNAILDAHTVYYTDLVEKSYELFPVSDVLELMRVVGVDIENIRVAWRRHVDNRDAAQSKRMVPSLHLFHELRSRYPTGVSMFQDLIDGLEGEPGDEAKEVVALATCVQAWYRALLGQPESQKVSEAIAGLRAYGDDHSLWLGIQGAALNYSYLGLVEEMISVTDEAITVGERMGDEFWVAGAKNWRSLAAIHEGDIETAQSLAEQARSVFEARNDYYFISWTFLLQATIAVIQERFEDAIAIYEKDVQVSQEIGYPRGMMLAFEGLGKTNLALGNLVEARSAFTESLRSAERTSMLTDLLGLMAKVGNVCALMGDLEIAVEVLATVMAHPLSNARTMTDPLSAGELASQPMDRLRGQLPADQFQAAEDLGRSRPYEVLLKQLLSNRYTDTKESVA